MPYADNTRSEAEHLLELGALLTGSVADRDLLDEAEWKAWREDVEVVADDVESRYSAVDFDTWGRRLRELWLRCAHRCSDRHFRSPGPGAPVVLPSGRRLAYSYERNVQPGALEERLAGDVRLPPGWHSDHIVYANGMASIANVLHVLQNTLRPSTDDPLRVGVWGAYFETGVLFELLRSAVFEPRSLSTQDELCRVVLHGEVDVLFLEAVRYDWDLEVLDLRSLLRAWAARSERPSILVIDKTLVSTAWPTRELLSVLTPSPPTLVVELRSGLKLDQQGLELANVGVVDLYTHEAAPVSAQQFGTLMRKMRTITGGGLSTDAIAALDAPFALSREWTAGYAERVFLNNALVARALETCGGLFERVVHPCLRHTSLPWAQAPFVVCHLADDTLENHGLLLAVLEYEAVARRLDLVRGSSFGFRGHRFESIIPKLSEPRGLFKIAMGFRSGGERNQVVSLLAEIAEYPDFHALRAAYPDVDPIDLTDLEN